MKLSFLNKKTSTQLRVEVFYSVNSSIIRGHYRAINNILIFNVDGVCGVLSIS